MREVNTLRNFGARIDAAKKFDLISTEQAQMLRTFGWVRNKFAHNVNWSFNKPETAEKCLKLHLNDYVFYADELAGDPEHRFLMNAASLCGQLSQALKNWTDMKFDPRQLNRPRWDISSS